MPILGSKENVENFTASDIKNYINDNYRGSFPHMFKVYICDRAELLPHGWYAGDVHYHSYYTRDQIEFGAPIEMTKKIAHAMGLRWFFVTDHSYDLDDKVDSFTENDHMLPKWELLKNECESLSDERVRICFGEEVSIGNHKKENVHLLSVNNHDFLKGKGDSFEVIFKNEPDELIKSLVSCQNKKRNDVEKQKIKPQDQRHRSLLIAAHPFHKASFIERLFLNRGDWHLTDYIDGNIVYLQIINGDDIIENLKLVNRYFKLLLTGKKFYILAGNDAHGNFQYNKHVSLPFVKLGCLRKQIFGNYFTAFYHNENDPIKGIQEKKVIVSNGPFLNFNASVSKSESLNDFTCSLNYEYEIKPEFGKLKNIELIIGDIYMKKITRIYNPKNDMKFNIKQDSFISMLLLTDKDYIALCNPIWINSEQ
jgi:hypothetical protein